MKKRLTPKTIDALPPAKGKRYEVCDEVEPGLRVRVSCTGSKMYYFCKRFNGRMTKSLVAVLHSPNSK